MPVIGFEPCNPMADAHVQRNAQGESQQRARMPATVDVVSTTAADGPPSPNRHIAAQSRTTRQRQWPRQRSPTRMLPASDSCGETTMAKRTAKPRASGTPQARPRAPQGNASHVPHLVPVSEAARLTGLSIRTIRRRLKAGSLSQSSQNGVVMVPLIELEKLNLTHLASGAQGQARLRAPQGHASGTPQAVALVESQPEELKMLLASVLELNRQLGETRKMLTTGTDHQAAELAELRDKATVAEVRAAGAEIKARWIGFVAGLLVVVAVGLVLTLVLR